MRNVSVLNKNISGLVFLTLSLYLIGCTRASKDDVSQIQIKFPEAKTQSLSKSASRKTTPSSTTALNCFVAFVGGPEDGLRKNNCKFKKPSTTTAGSVATTETSQIFFSPWAGGVKSGESMTLEVPSGKDRYIVIVGMQVFDLQSCVDFKSNDVPRDTQSTDAFIVGQAGGLSFDPGATVEVPIQISYDSSSPKIDGCEGPDAPKGASGGGSGDNNNTPYIRVEGVGQYYSVVDEDKATVNECYPIQIGLFQGQGSPWVETSGNIVNVNVANNGLGQFYAGTTCSTGSEVAEIPIPVGVNRSLTQSYSFKPSAITTTASASSMALTIASGTTQVFQNQQKFRLGEKQFVIYGPSKIVTGSCHPYKLQFEKFEGTTIGITSNMDINFNTNASYYINSSSDCSTTDPLVTIYSGYPSVNFSFRIMTAGTYDLSNILTTSNGIRIKSSVVTTSNSQNYYNYVQIKNTSNGIRSGDCATFQLNLYNQDGAVVYPFTYMNLYLGIPKDIGEMYYDDSCGYTVNSSGLVYLSPGVRDYTFSYKLNSTNRMGNPITAIDFVVKAPNLSSRLDNNFNSFSGILPNVISFPVDGNTFPASQIFIDKSNINSARFIGSHEFDDGGSPSTYKNIVIDGNYTDVIDIECSPYNYSTYTSCTAAQVDRSGAKFKFKWTASDAMSNVSTFVRLKFNNAYQYSNVIEISTYKILGSNSKVISCDSIAASGAQDFSTIQALAGPNVCLPANSTYTKQSTASAFMMTSTRHKIIGHSSLTSKLIGGSYSGDLIQTTNGFDYGDDVIIANLILEDFSNNQQAIYVNQPNPTYSYPIEINNIKIVNNTLSRTLIHVLNCATAQCQVNIQDVQILNTVASDSIFIEESSNVSIQNVGIENSANTGSTIKVVATAQNSGDSIKLQNVNIKTQGASGLDFSCNNIYTYLCEYFEIQSSRFVRQTAGAGALVTFSGKITNGKIENSLFMQESNNSSNSLLAMASGSNSYPLSFALNGNSFIQGASGGAMITASGGSIGMNQISDLNMNSFSYINQTVANSGGVFNLAANSNLYLGKSAQLFSGDTTGGNLACTSSSFAMPFSTVSTGATLGDLYWSGTPNFPVSMNKFDQSSGRCY